MLHFSTILVPVDSSQRSSDAVQYAVNLARQFTADVVTVHARRKHRERDRMTPVLRHHLIREQIEEPGEPEDVIPRVALQTKADAIVVWSRGRRALRGLIRPSLTAELIRRAHCPVITCSDVRQPVPEDPITTVLCATALGPSSDRLVRWADRLSRSVGARLAVAHADGQLPPSGYPCDGEWRSWIRRAARDELRSTLRSAGAERAEVWLESGRPASAIGRLADEVRADLIVVGRSPAEGRWRRLRMKCLDIASEALCPVAVV